MISKSSFAVLVVALCAACSSKDEPTPDASTPDAAQEMGTADLGAPDMSDAPDAQEDTGVDMSACSYTVDEPESIPTPDRIYTPRWAFKPWISKDISDTDDTYAFVNGFEERNIPVGTVVLDSPWETNYHTFVPNPERYGNFEQLVSDLRARDVRLVLWMTALINEVSFDAETGGDYYDGASPNYDEAVQCDFFINDGRKFVWWKGRGGSLDFFDPVARQWWHEQQDALYEMGIAGWKLDFGEEYVRLDEVETDEGTKTHQEYSEAYYRDFYDYGIHKLGHEEFVTMVRGYDKSYDFDGRFFARPENAPIVWMGDNVRSWVGLEDALDHEFRSALAGYVVVGSDLGGYLDRDDQNLNDIIPFDRTNFHRWLAQAAMTPFMQLHGRKNLTPWSLPDDPDVDESVANYRFWSHLHTELVPFWYSLAEEAYAGNTEPIMRPIGDEASWPGDYRYMLGDAFLIAPILDETGVREVDLPEGVFYDWWNPTTVVTGPTTVNADFSGNLRGLPIYVKSGALIPFESESDWTGVTRGGLADTDIILAWPDATPSSFVRHDRDGEETTIAAELSGGVRSVTVSRSTRTTVVRFRDDNFTEVRVNGNAVAAVNSEAELLNGPSYLVFGNYVWVSAPVGAETTFEIE